MNNNKTNKENQKGSEKQPCCRPEECKECCPDNDKAVSGCCGGGEEPDGTGKCFSKCRYFPLVPVIMGTVFLLLGYFLSPEATRVLWMVGAGLIMGMGLFGLIAINRMAGKLAASHC